MDLVAERKKDGIRCGSILYGMQTRIMSKQDVAYIESSDVHIGEFTVRQNLVYAALLRLGAGMTTEALDKCVIDAAMAVGLSNKLDVIVGTDLVKGISGGQKKRLSIATELLAVPSILCLDEPTSGIHLFIYLFILLEIVYQIYVSTGIALHLCLFFVS